MIFFITGLCLAIISTLDIRFISHGRAYASGLVSFISSMIGMAVVVQIMQNINLYGIKGVIAYSAGIGVGTILTIKYHIVDKAKV